MARPARSDCVTRITVMVCALLVGTCMLCEGHYLRASSRWLVKESDGARVKLACVNWAGHLETMLPEGLNRQPLYKLAFGVKNMGFNCVRLTFATYMLTNATLSRRTVTESFTHENLQHSLKGIAIHNPDLVNLSIQAAFVRVVERLTHMGLLIILDNHVSKPQWCCENNDGNGFWGDTFFDSNSWLRGLSLVASLFNGNSEVVGISLRNELRGPKQNIRDWYKYMSLGANVVHEANPKLLIIISGLHFATDLQFLPKNHFSTLPFQDKLVYEMHWYTSSYGINFAKGNLNKACAIATSSIMKCGAFMATPLSNESFTAPLLISEFGIDQRGGNKGNNRFINCFFAFMASMDLDWAYWPLQGDYYVRNGHEGDEEFYGMLNSQWNAPRNISLLARLQAIQLPWQSNVANTSPKGDYQVLYHPSTGMCVHKGGGNKLLLGTCVEENTHWQYTSQGRLEITNSYLSIASEGEGQIAKLVPSGTEKNGPWNLASVAKLQFATTINNTHHHSVAKSLEESRSYAFRKFDNGNKFDDDSNHYDQIDNWNDDKKTNISETYDTLIKNGKIQPYHHHVTNIYDHHMGATKEESLAKPQPILRNPRLCLDGRTPPSITTEKCLCVQEGDVDCAPDDDPSPQWFVLISSNRQSHTMEHAII